PYLHDAPAGAECADDHLLHGLFQAHELHEAIVHSLESHLRVTKPRTLDRDTRHRVLEVQLRNDTPPEGEQEVHRKEARWELVPIPVLDHRELLFLLPLVESLPLSETLLPATAFVKRQAFSFLS